MKKTILLSVICLGLIRPTIATAQRVVNKILEAKEIRIGTTMQQPPFSMKSKSGSYIGFDIDIGYKLATSINVRAKFIEMNFADLLDALEKGEIDIVLSGMAITPKRNLKFLFAGPYLVSGKSILTKSPKIINTRITELNLKRITVATLKGSTSASYVDINLPNSQKILVDSYDEAVDMVINGKVDFMLADYSECAYASIRHQGQGLKIKEQLLNTERIGIAIPSDDPLLHNLIQNLISELEGSGELEKIEDKWFRSGSWLAEIE